MRKFSSSIERVVGNIPEHNKERILQEKADRFDNQRFDELVGKERAKTPDEVRILSLANDATNKIRRRYGLGDFDIPKDNIHMIREEQWPESEKGVAFYAQKLQAVAMREQDARITTAHEMFHELLHFKSYNALQVTDRANVELAEYRVGLTVNTRDGKIRFFSNLNEAVTEEMARRFVLDHLDHPYFSSETKHTRDTMEIHPNAKTQSGEQLFDDSIYYADAKQENVPVKSMIGRLFGKRDIRIRIDANKFTYGRERNILYTLISKLVQRNRDRFKDNEEVFDIFAKGMMTGNIIPLGKLIDQTFGHGTFRRIGELDDNIDDQEKFVNKL